MKTEVEELKEKVAYLQKHIHDTANEAAIQYAKYELRIRELKKELKKVSQEISSSSS